MEPFPSVRIPWVKHLPLYAKVEGSSPTTTAGIGKENFKNIFLR